MRPQFVLLDLQLPKVGGLEVLRQLRENERTSLLPVVILTTSMEEGDLVNSYKLGANSYIRKPADFNQFTGMIKHLVAYWLVLNEPPADDWRRKMTLTWLACDDTGKTSTGLLRLFKAFFM